MPFTVENGTVVSGANSFADVAFADDYFELRGVSKWALLPLPSKQAALILATDYIQVRYGDKLIGKLFQSDQPLSFPRVYNNDGLPVMPDALLKATCEYAVRASEKPLQPDPVLGADGRMPIKVVEEVGPIREEYAYSDVPNGQPALRTYPEADALMGLLMYKSNGLVRA